MLLLLGGAAALWGSSSLVWDASADRRGDEVVPALGPLALLCLAAIAAVVALGGRLRRALGVLVAAAGGTAAFLGLSTAGAPAGRGLAALAGALVLGAGAVLVVRGPAMPGLGGGYRTPGAARRAADPERELWNALERGDDPTDRD
ncbi:tryptophan-associated transmembrane protein [Saccharothrix australiensis]|uniref:Tryptophan-associated transmembrane protein n=1 Tax=Saccharothrix australiensis TaxID=2072 RepID=A0A495W5U1_9PSEU|nr:tryptophan-associated transmembrane protein [Saccharothrix australiensis]